MCGEEFQDPEKQQEGKGWGEGKIGVDVAQNTLGYNLPFMLKNRKK